MAKKKAKKAPDGHDLVNHIRLVIASLPKPITQEDAVKAKETVDEKKRRLQLAYSKCNVEVAVLRSQIAEIQATQEQLGYQLQELS